MYLYAAAISAIKGSRQYITVVCFEHSSSDLSVVEQFALEQCKLELPASDGYREHGAIVDKPDDAMVLRCADYLKKGK